MIPLPRSRCLPREMEPIDRPGWLVDATCAPPPSRAALFGWYRPAWCPWIRLELRRTDGHDVAAWYCLEERDGTSGWRASLRHELAPAQDGFGFSVVDDPYHDRRTLRYAYNEGWSRFELQIMTGDPPHITRMPLARIPPPLPGQASVPFAVFAER